LFFYPVDARHKIAGLRDAPLPISSGAGIDSRCPACSNKSLHGNGGALGDFFGIVWLSIGVSLAATAIAGAIGLPLGAALAIYPFRGRRLAIVLTNAFFGLPPVVVGLVLYLALSRSGPLGFAALLYTPAAMVIAQAVLAAPIITALVHRASERAWARYGDELICDGATYAQAVPRFCVSSLLTF